jgi:hypothetical protein
MAGSWKHMITDDGRLRNNETFNGMLENGGDCYEAAEECYGMVHYLADQMAQMTRVGGGMFVARSAGELIEEARENYAHGVRLGGVQSEDESEPEDEEEPVSEDFKQAATKLMDANDGTLRKLADGEDEDDVSSRH